MSTGLNLVLLAFATSHDICFYLMQAFVEECALELVECIGQFDSGLSSQYLALYQVSGESEDLVSAANI